MGTFAYAKSKDWGVAQVRCLTMRGISLELSQAVSSRIVADAFANSDEADLDIHAFTKWSRGQSEEAWVR